MPFVIFVLYHSRHWDLINKLKKAHSIYCMATAVLCMLTHWGRETHICVSKLTITGTENGLSPGRRQAIIWTSAGILLIWTLGTNVSEILIKINSFSLKKMHLKMSSGRRQPSCLGLNVLITWYVSMIYTPSLALEAHWRIDIDYKYAINNSVTYSDFRWHYCVCPSISSRKNISKH